MAILKVRKDGSETYTTILDAYMAASSGDIVDIGEGTFIESIEIFKNNLTFVGASKATTIIQGIPFAAVQTVSVCSWTSGDNFFVVGGVAALPAFTVGMSVSDSTSGANSPSGAQITSIDVANRKIYINKNFTTTLASKIIKHWGKVGAIELRASGFTMSKIKVMDDSTSQVDGNASAIYIGASVANQGASKVTGTSSTGFNISDCEFVAVGDYAMLSDANAAVGNGSVTNCLFSGKTFSGVNPVAGNVRQGVVFQAQNLPMDFTNNVVDVICGGMTSGGVYSGNQAVTIDANGSIVSGNKIRARAQDGSGNYISLGGLALRMRGNANTVSNNTNKCYSGLTNLGFLVTPSWTNMNSRAMAIGEIVWVSGNRFFKCIEAHTVVTAGGSANPPAGAGASKWLEITSDADLAAQMLAKNYGYYVQNVNSNITVLAPLVDPVQPTSADQLQVSFQKSSLLQHPSVSGTDFGSESNWFLVSCIYKKTGASQRLTASFKDFSGISKKPKMKAGMGAGDQFELHKIIISKQDRTMVVLKRSEIDEASDSDFSLK